MLPLQLHNGEPFDKEMFQPVENDPTPANYRPFGGYWLSDYTPDSEYDSPWIEFVYTSHIFEDGIESHNEPVSYVYQVISEKIYEINDYEAFIHLLLRYPIRGEGFLNLDFEKVALDFDAIYLTKQGFSICRSPNFEILERHDLSHITPPSLESWDIPSMLVLHPDILN